jgi:aldose 1-epimerase
MRWSMGVVASAWLAAAPCHGAEARREVFGQLDGQAVAAVTLSNGAGMKARIIAYGAAIQELDVPDRDGKVDDLVLSYPDMKGFIEKPQYFGATTGRYANRIANATFTLDGQRYTLAKNDGPNSLHGGKRGFDQVLWTVTDMENGPEASVTLRYVSPDGEEGFPGALTVDVTYALNEKNELAIRYRATTTKPTVVNLTNHSYFNLAGAASGRDILGHRLTIFADRVAAADKGSIPTGVFRQVANTPFDFRTPHPIGERVRDGSESEIVFARGYSHHWLLNAGRSKTPSLAARVEDPVSGRVLELLTTEAGVVMYSGNYLDATSVGKSGYIYRQSGGFCLEPGALPDSPNRPEFPSTRLNPTQVYEQVSVFRFSTASR